MIEMKDFTPVSALKRDVSCRGRKLDSVICHIMEMVQDRKYGNVGKLLSFTYVKLHVGFLLIPEIQIWLPWMV